MATAAVDDDAEEMQIVVVFGVVEWWWSLQGVVAVNSVDDAQPVQTCQTRFGWDAGIRLQHICVLFLFCLSLTPFDTF